MDQQKTPTMSPDVKFDFWLMALADQISEAIERLNEIANQPEEPQMMSEPLEEIPPVQPRKKRRRRPKQGKKGDPEIPRSLTIFEQPATIQQPRSQPNQPARPLIGQDKPPPPSTLWTDADFPPLC